MAVLKNSDSRRNRVKANRPNFDKEIRAISDYVVNHKIESQLAIDTAYYCFLDSLACAFMALSNPHCKKY